MSSPSALAKALNLPRTRLFRTLGVLAALLAFMVGALGSGGAMLQNLYAGWDLQKRHSIMLYLPPATPPAALAPLTTMLLGEPSIASIRQLAPAEVQAALSSVLPPSGTLPLPIVAEIIVQPGANRPAVQALLQQSFPTAELDDQAPMLDAVAQSVRLLQAFGGLIALGLGVVLGLFMALTIRAGLLAQHGTVALLIQLGATDGTLARTLAYQATLPVLVGTAIGSALAAVGLALGAAWQGLALGIGVWAMAFLPVVILPALALSIGAWVAWRLLHYA